MTTTPVVEEVEFSLGEILNLKDTLQKLFEAKLPIKISYRLSRFLVRVNDEYENFEKKRLELFKRYGEENDQQQMVISNENIDSFSTEMQDLMAEPILVKMVKINIEDLDGKVDLSPIDIARLDKLLLLVE
jgi:hypothetical protein